MWKPVVGGRKNLERTHRDQEEGSKNSAQCISSRSAITHDASQLKATEAELLQERGSNERVSVRNGKESWLTRGCTLMCLASGGMVHVGQWTVHAAWYALCSAHGACWCMVHWCYTCICIDRCMYSALCQGQAISWYGVPCFCPHPASAPLCPL